MVNGECHCTYEGHPKSFRPRHIRQQYFSQFIHLVKRTFFTDLYESAADMKSL